MNKQRKVLITTTYNEMGIIIDTKVEEVAQPNLQPTCNQLATDTISRQMATDALRKMQTYKMFEGDDVILIDQAGAMTELMLLPPTEPKKIRGQWSIKGQAIDTVRGYWATCSACGHAVFGGGNYCPNCGSYNKGEVIT